MAVEAADIGGIWLAWFGDDLDDYCQAFPFDQAEKALSTVCDDEEATRRHYPWIAFAVGGYRRATERGRNPGDIKPSDFAKLLKQVADTARKLDAGLTDLEERAHAAIANGNTPKFLAYAQAYRRICTAFEWPHERWDADMAALRSEMIKWQAHLESIASLALRSKERLEKDAQAKGGHGPLFVGLDGFISVLAAVWTSMTGKQPSAERLKGSDDENPPFVRFVREIAVAASLPPPTSSMVQTALNPRLVGRNHARLVRVPRSDERQ